MELQARRVDRDARVGRNRMRQPDVAANHRPFADHRIAAEGAQVILWGRERVALEAIDKELTERGLRCASYLCDVSRRDSIYDTA